jgi:multidrug transporter EmrE-like cation transporter
MFNLNYLFILSAVVVIAAGQIIFKYAAQQLQFIPSQSYVELLRTNLLPASLVAIALALYSASTVLWVIALRSVPLSVAFMFNSLAFILVPWAGFALFGEPVPRFFTLSIALIVGGIFLLSFK